LGFGSDRFVKMTENLVFVAKATIKVQFPAGNEKPGYLEMLKFAFELGLEAADIDSMYQEYTERNRALFIKVKSNELVKDIVGRTFESNFKFENGLSVKVQLSEANGNLKYVRIFNLIPEVEDENIAAVMEQFGTIKKLVKEKFPAALGVDIFTGVRGVFMEISKPLPPYVAIGNLRAKLFYQGMSEGCFYCNGTDHVKKDCPKKFTPVSRAQRQSYQPQQQPLQQQPLQQQPTQQQQQSRHSQQNFIVSPLAFPTLADIIQNNITNPFGENRMLAPNNTPQQAMVQQADPNDHPISNDTNIAVTVLTETTSEQSEESDDDSLQMECAENLAGTPTENASDTRTERRVTRSGATNQSNASRSNSLKKTKKAGNKAKKIKSDVLERIARSKEDQDE
jgi:hypothetical protein